MKHYKSRTDLLDLVRKQNARWGIEIGTHLGKFAKTILDRTSLDLLYCVDPWTGPFYTKRGMDPEWRYEQACAALLPYGDRVKLLRTVSLEAVEQFADESLDFIYIDALHRYEGIMADLNAWWPKCRKGGVFAGHDYYSRHKCGVERAVNEFFHARDRTFRVTDERLHATWYLIK